MKPSITIITLGTADLKKSTDFYTSLGFPLNEHSNDGVSFFELPGSWLGLYPFDKLADDACVPELKADTFRGVTLAHNLGSKEEVDIFYHKTLEAGATSLKTPQDAFWGGYHAYVHDLDKHIWEIAWNPYF